MIIRSVGNLIIIFSSHFYYYSVNEVINDSIKYDISKKNLIMKNYEK